MIERTPENSAELAVLGALIEHNSQCWGLRGELRAEMFTKGVYRLVFNQIKKMSEAEEHVDSITLSEALRNSDMISVVDIMEMTDSAFLYHNFSHYRDIVVKTYNSRLMYETMYEIINGDTKYENDEIVKKMLDAIEDVQSSGHSGFEHLADSGDEAFDLLTWRFDNPDKPLGRPTGFIDLDRITGGFQGGRVYIIGARPSHGKTALAMQMGTHVAKQGDAVGVISTEMTGTQLYLRQLFSEARVDSNLINFGEIEKSTFNHLISKKADIDSLPLYINEVGLATASSVLAQARRLVAQHKIKMLIVDYIQLMNEYGEGNRNLELGKISRMLKLFAKAMNIPVIILSQLSREAEGREGVLSDLRDSGTLEQDADCVMFLFRPERSGLDSWKGEDTKGLAVVNVAKNRDGQVGQTRLAFIGQYVRFENYISSYVEGLD